MKKKCGSKFGPEVSKSVQELDFLPFFQVWFINFP